MRNVCFGSAVFVLSMLAGCGDSGSGGQSAGGGTSEGGSPSEGGSGEGGSPSESCGDGVLDAGEACDNGDANADTAACTAACENASCGDGLLLAGGEECDDGPDNSDTGSCTSGCVLAACGDGLVESGVEECDDGADNGDDAACLSTCDAANCGDGFVQQGEEECDQGDDNADTCACTSACVTASCGDGLVQTNVEACDDGNQNDNDACTNDCALASCGDGVVQAGEACDLGVANSNTGGCTLACLLPICGDGFVQPTAGEQCDLGGANNNSGACTLSCDNAVCGDGLTQTGIEPCDDGNAVQGDGCNNNCVVSATVQWTQTYTNNAGGAEWSGVTTDAAGNVYVVGAEETAAQGLNIVVRRYTAAGAISWTQTLSGAANLDDQGFGITLDPAGNVVVLGYETLANGTTNLLVAKLVGTNGSLVWSYSYDGGLGGNDFGFGIAANAAGDLLVTGQVENNAAQGYNTLVAKLAGINGTVVWADFANGLANADDGGNGITIDGAGNIIAAGFVRNSTTDDIWLRKYTDTGVSFTTVWTRTYNGTGNAADSAFAVAADASNNVVLAGFETTSAQAANAFIRKYNANGDVLWTQTNSGAAGLNDIAYGVDIDVNGAVVVGGFISVANDTADVWTRKYTSGGTAMWTNTFNGSADIDDVGYALVTDASANVLVAGREVANGPIVNAWLRKYAP